MGNKCSTVKGKLNGVRWHHLYAGLANPLENKFQVASALRMLKKLRGDSTGKLPVTPEILRCIGRTLDFGRERDVVTWAAVNFGFFFMMRSSEYLASGGVFEPTRALTVDKCLPHIGDAPTDTEYLKADSVTVLFEASKTDQNRVGCTRTCYATKIDLCPVAAYKRLRLMRENGTAGSNWRGDQPLMMANDGWTCSREWITAVLKAAAIDCGIAGTDVATHSLRIGGATTAAASGTIDYEDIRRFGRWKSDCWRRYVYSERSRCKGFAFSMAAANYTLEMSARDFANATATAAAGAA